jgi:RHS repeat-associated protein
MRRSFARLSVLTLAIGLLPAAVPQRLAAPAVAAANSPALLGDLPYYKFDRHQLTDRLSLAVNIGSGNLVVEATDFTIHGTGLDVGIKRYFNSRSSEHGSLGRGWTMGAGHDVQLVRHGDGTVTFYGPSGFQATFKTPDASGNFVTPDDYSYADLRRESSGEYLLKFHKSEEKLRFNSDGVLITDTDRDGNTIRYGYSAGAILTTLTDTQGRVMTFDYETCKPGNGNGDKNHCHAGPGNKDVRRNEVGTIHDWTGRQTRTTYNAAGEQVAFIDAAGAEYRFEYDNGRLTAISDPEHIDTTLTFDSLGRVLTLTRAANTKAAATTRFEYRDASTLMTDPNGHTTTYDVDDKGRITKTTDPLGHSRETAFDAKYNVTELKDALSGVVKLEHDLNNNLTKIQAPGGTGGDGPSTSFDYTDSNHPHAPTSETDPQKNTSSYNYTNAGSLSSVTTPDGAKAKNGYQGDDGVTCGAHKGQLCWTEDFRSHKTFQDYDSAGNLIRIRPPAPLGATTITPDALSRPAVIVDGKGQAATYVRDANDRITEVRYGGAKNCQPQKGTCVAFQYDRAGNLVRRTDVTGTTTFAYDGQNRVVTKQLSIADDESDHQGHGGQGDDERHDITTALAYDPAGNVVAYKDPFGTTAYTFDAANNLVSLAEPGGSCNGTRPRRCTTFRSDDNGRRIGVSYPNGVELKIAYDNAGRETTLTASKGSTVLFKRAYDYLIAGQDTALRQTMTDESGTKTTYHYGQRNQLEAAQAVGAGGSILSDLSWGYDPNGNRTSDAAGSHTFNDANEITDGGYGHDRNGNVLTGAGRTYGYNLLNQTAGVSRGNSTLGMAYADVDSTERVKAGNTYFLNGPLGLTGLAERGRVVSFTRDPNGNLIAMNTDGASHYFILDALGSVIGLTDGAGNVSAKYSYQPFGETTSSGPMANINPFRFGGGQTDDATGLVKFGTRYYDPAIGRWTQQDPVGHSIADPAQFNRYVYVGNDPINHTDASGYFDIGFSPVGVLGSTLKGAIGGAIGGAVGGCVLGALPTAWGGGFGCLPGALGGLISGAAVGAVGGLLASTPLF